MNCAVHHYYHVYADGAWEEAVEEHTSALRESGLAAYPGFLLNVGLVGSEQNRTAVLQYLAAIKLKSRLVASQPAGWEQVTLHALAQDSWRHDGFAFYAHTKGASVQTRFNTAWRRRMTHFNVTKWRAAVGSLRTVDAYGCHWMELQGNWIFGGNFWWTHMRHLRLIGTPKMDNRWNAEGWIGTLRHHIPLKVCDPAPPFPGQVEPLVA